MISSMLLRTINLGKNGSAKAIRMTSVVPTDMSRNWTSLPTLSVFANTIHHHPLHPSGVPRVRSRQPTNHTLTAPRIRSMTHATAAPTNTVHHHVRSTQVRYMGRYSGTKIKLRPPSKKQKKRRNAKLRDELLQTQKHSKPNSKAPSKKHQAEFQYQLDKHKVLHGEYPELDDGGGTGGANGGDEAQWILDDLMGNTSHLTSQPNIKEVSVGGLWEERLALVEEKLIAHERLVGGMNDSDMAAVTHGDHQLPSDAELAALVASYRDKFIRGLPDGIDDEALQITGSDGALLLQSSDTGITNSNTSVHATSKVPLPSEGKTPLATILHLLLQTYSIPLSSLGPHTISSLLTCASTPAEIQSLTSSLGPSAQTPHSYAILVHSHAQRGEFQSCASVIRDMLAAGHTPNNPAYTSLFAACAKVLRVPHLPQHLKKEALDVAWSHWKELRILGVDADVMAYGGIISCHAALGHAEKCLDLLQEMEAFDVLPTAYCFGVALRGVSNSHAQAIRFLGGASTKDRRRGMIAAHHGKMAVDMVILAETAEVEMDEGFVAGMMNVAAVAGDVASCKAILLSWEVRQQDHLRHIGSEAYVRRLQPPDPDGYGTDPNSSPNNKPPQASKRLLNILLHAIEVSMSTNGIGDLWSGPTNKGIFDIQTQHDIQTFVPPNYADLSEGDVHPLSAHIATASMKFDVDTDEPEQEGKRLRRSKMRNIKVDHESDADLLEWYDYQNNIKPREEKRMEDQRAQLTHGGADIQPTLSPGDDDENDDDSEEEQIMSDYIDARLKALHRIPDVPDKTNDLEAQSLDPEQTLNDPMDVDNQPSEIAVESPRTSQDLDLDNLTDEQITAIFEDDDNDEPPLEDFSESEPQPPAGLQQAAEHQLPSYTNDELRAMFENPEKYDDDARAIYEREDDAPVPEADLRDVMDYHTELCNVVGNGISFDAFYAGLKEELRESNELVERSGDETEPIPGRKEAKDIFETMQQELAVLEEMIHSREEVHGDATDLEAASNEPSTDWMDEGEIVTTEDDFAMDANPIHSNEPPEPPNTLRQRQPTDHPFPIELPDPESPPPPLTELEEFALFLPPLPISRIRKLHQLYAMSFSYPSMLRLLPLLREVTPEYVDRNYLVTNGRRQAKHCLRTLEECGLEKDVFVMNHYLKVLAAAGGIDETLSFHATKFQEKGLQPNNFSDRAIIKMLMKNNRLSRALKFKHWVESPQDFVTQYDEDPNFPLKPRKLDVLSYASMIEHCAHKEELGSALLLLKECVNIHGYAPGENALRKIRSLCRKHNLDDEIQELEALVGKDPYEWIAEGETLYKREYSKKGNRHFREMRNIRTRI